VTLRLAALFLLIQLGASSVSPGVPQRTNASIAGTVVRLGTREPIEDVHVVLVPVAAVEPIDLARLAPAVSVLTDSLGRFVIGDVEPGTYRIAFSANGYVRQEYLQRAFPGNGAPVTVTAGQNLKDLVESLTPAAAISGSIFDVDKRPLVGVPVQLMRYMYDSDGFASLRPYGVGRTNDRGEYRIFYVTPGRYYLNAGTPQGPPGRDETPGANEPRETYSNAFFPGVSDVKSASPIDIQSGANLTGMDLTLTRQKQYRVRGRIIDTTTGKAPVNPEIKLNYRDPGSGYDYDIEYRGGEGPLYQAGVFEFRNVNPGFFTVSATADESVAVFVPGRETAAPTPTPNQRFGYIPVQVSAEDVDGLALTISPGTSIQGIVKIDGQEFRPDVLYSGGQGFIYLSPSTNGARPGVPGLRDASAKISSDGSFRWNNVMPGEYRIRTYPKSQFFLKQARFGTSDLLKNPLQFTGRESGTLELVFSSNVAAVEGVVTDNRLGPAVGAQVVLVPDAARFRSELFKTAVTDQNGRFNIGNIAPGDYKLYAWESIEQNGWFDMDLAKRFEQSARPVHLTESSRQTIDARLIR